MDTSRKVPDAWDDDWVSTADVSQQQTIAAFTFCLHSYLYQKLSAAPPDPLPSSTTLTKAERRAKQAELNKQIWQDACVAPARHFDFWLMSLGSLVRHQKIHSF